ncbi:hypothetical protein ACJX0J_027562 [Zea mays]
MKSSHFSILSRVINGSSMEITRSKENLVFIHNELLIIEGRIRHRLLIGLYEDLSTDMKRRNRILANMAGHSFSEIYDDIRAHGVEASRLGQPLRDLGRVVM